MWQLYITVFEQVQLNPLNPDPSVDGPSSGLWRVMGYERSLLVQNNNLVPPKGMGYEALRGYALCVMRGAG